MYRHHVAREPMRSIAGAVALLVAGCGGPSELGGPTGPSPTGVDLRCEPFAREVPVTVRFFVHERRGADRVELLATDDDGATWRSAGVESIGDGSRGEFLFSAEDGRHGLAAVLRASGTDRGSGAPSGLHPSATVTIDRVAPIARITSADLIEDATGGGARARVVVESSDAGPAGVEHVEILAAGADGFPLRSLGRFGPREPIEIDAGFDQGILRLHAVARDRAGNEEPRPLHDAEPEAIVAVGVPAFEVRIVSLSDVPALAGGSRQYVFLRVFPKSATAEVERISLFYRMGEDGPWETIANELPFTSRVLWRVPNATHDRCFFQVRYTDRQGRTGESVHARSIPIDSSPPDARVVGAEDLGGGRVLVKLDWEEDRPAGVSRVWLYRTGGAGESGSVDWVPLGSVEARSRSRVFEVPRGRLGLVAAGEDRAGNREPAPLPGDEPDIWVEVTETEAAPVLTLENFHGGGYPGGGTHFIFWRYRDAPDTLAPTPFDVSYTADDGDRWVEIARELPAPARKVAWTIPKLDSTAVRVRVRARLASGESIEAVSVTPFVVDSRSPVVVFEGPTTSTERRTTIRFSVLADAPPGGTADAESGRLAIDRVACYIARSPGGDWNLAGTWRAGDSPATDPWIDLELDNGRYRVALVAWDRLGNRSTIGDAGDPGMGTLLVDTVDPYLRVTVEPEIDLYAAGDRFLVNVHADDPHLPAFPVRISLIDASNPDGSRRVLEPYFPASGKYLVQVPLESARFVLEVAAEDLAGNRAVFEHRFRVVPRRPEVRFVGLHQPASLLGGSLADVRWETRFVGADRPAVRIDFSDDGGVTWTELVDEHENTGRWTWDVPRVDLRGALLRITVRRETGQEATALSAPITISTTAPRVIVERVTPLGDGSASGRLVPLDASDPLHARGGAGDRAGD